MKYPILAAALLVALAAVRPAWGQALAGEHQFIRDTVILEQYVLCREDSDEDTDSKLQRASRFIAEEFMAANVRAAALQFAVGARLAIREYHQRLLLFGQRSAICADNILGVPELLTRALR
ncbi:hypothetical protein [Roseococcus pinisoli]|uniref:Uncharacterized protein n=1 Tax=Roseococcus pinisoli TaxID=2835040 RepID=A0ABS5QET4_9PROT|nr:hypothetical protein [Roseococcus pinisoli]MBS7812204.1 hypothetical protein [Roseococcus pinisoli]